MARLVLFGSLFFAFASILLVVRQEQPSVFSRPASFLINLFSSTANTTAIDHSDDQDLMRGSAVNMSKSTLRQASIKPHRSGSRGHSDHGWLNTYHSFSFANWFNPNFTHFGSLRVLNEDRVKAKSGFPTHRHQDFEIFSYILSGELTHRDSTMTAKGAQGEQSDKFSRMHRGDVQFTTGGRGISHSEMNEHETDTVHFLQIWALPWKRGLTPQYHTKHFDEQDKKNGFVTILSPLKAGEEASAQQEEEAEPAVDGSIPIHADFAMGAGIVAAQKTFEWTVGARATRETKRKVYVHLPMTKGGKARIRLDGREDAELCEGDGAFVEGVSAGDRLAVESIGEAEAEVIVLDTA
ncbi:hypothetical protein CDD83_10101 [Cordyceps sp. RAO-2017]|nr:hypothetical protein CDD83_10101 [Cordyceps sp. RAO-2017]